MEHVATGSAGSVADRHAVPVQFENVTKRYGKTVAVTGLSFALSPGTITALVGPNGAGKTTLLESIVGLRPPDSGRVRLLGVDIAAEPARLASLLEDVGIQLQDVAFFSSATLRDCLLLFSRCYQRRIDPAVVVDRFGLGDQLEKRLSQLSGGWRQRAFLALALINDPSLVLLDEPTTGLDPEARRELWEIILELRRSGKTVLLSTHSMEEAERLAGRVLMMGNGRLVADGTPQELIFEHAPGGNLEDVYLKLLSRRAG